jgi:hypothetical protein
MLESVVDDFHHQVVVVLNVSPGGVGFVYKSSDNAVQVSLLHTNRCSGD